MRALLLLLPAVIFSAASPPPAATEDQPQAVCQKTVFLNSCGPCSIYNSLVFGDPSLRAIAAQVPGASPEDKVRGLILSYGARPSVVHPDQPRFSTTSNEGINGRDEMGFFNDLLQDHKLPPVQSERLGVLPHETPDDQLHRIHDLLAQSLKAGLPPVLMLATFIPHGARILHPTDAPDEMVPSTPDSPASPSAEATPQRQNWQRLAGHDVCVVGVGDLEAGAPGFSIWVANSQSGEVVGAYIYSDATQRRPYVLNGRPDSSPYLLILGLAAPAISWNERTFRTVMAVMHW